MWHASGCSARAYFFACTTLLALALFLHLIGIHLPLHFGATECPSMVLCTLTVAGLPSPHYSLPRAELRDSAAEFKREPALVIHAKVLVCRISTSPRI